jgi:hypothetical protein
MAGIIGLTFFFLFILIVSAAICWVAFTQIRARRSGLPAPSWRSYIPFIKSHGGGGGSGSGLPSPRSSNPIEWIKDKLHDLRRGRNRTAQGHYEEAGGYAGGGGLSSYSGAGGRRARGMDPDEAWDARVGNEADAYGATPLGAYHEEQELGLAPTPGLDNPYHGSALPAYGEGADARGRSRSRDPPGVIGGQKELDSRYDEEMGGTGTQQHKLGDSNNPFSDSHEAASVRGVSPRPMVDSSAGQGGRRKGGGGGQDDSPTERRSMFRESL